MKRNRTAAVFCVLLLCVLSAVSAAYAEMPPHVAGAETGMPLLAADAASDEKPVTAREDSVFAFLDYAANIVKEEPLAIEETLQSMSTEEKILQLFIVDPEEMNPDVPHVTEMSDTFRSRLTEYPVGGIIFFAGNLNTPKQTRMLVTSIRDYSIQETGLPPFLCVDEEGGRVARVSNNAAFGLQKTGAMNTITTEEEARNAGYYIGSYLYMLGFNMNLAPVADVLTVADNKSIGDRSFGNDPMKVTRLAGAFSDGLHAAGIMNTYKHFPGDGATATDTHNGFAYTEKTLDELLSCELLPFADAQCQKADAVMTAHISLPGVTGDNTPASLSRTLTTDILRGRLGYEGMIITDSLEMGAVIQNYTSSQASVSAILAGADLILQPDDFQEALWGLKQAVKKGELSMDRLDASVRRIITAKRRLLRNMEYVNS